MSEQLKAIARRRPVDATAARVTSAGPKGYESDKVITDVCQPEPPAMRPVPGDVPNMIGRQSGQLTVVGLSANKGGQAGPSSRWVCRCACGYYTERATRAVRRGSEGLTQGAGDRCSRCRQVLYLRRASAFRQLGYNPDDPA